ncbi:unnamed protein product [Rotaria socialis]|uniref:Transient receptor ion channel domain-containing protein n=1 Tax=Rotaria socialis TaxID=392032 RepID=A0A818D2A6_9BILA|nr:unnamed protein product [Rotaria socialis]CAF4537011.1 unnamed protein product [Rotaria socialis]
MSVISSSAIATVNAKRFSIRTQRNMRKRGGAAGGGGGGGAPAATGSGGRSNLYQQMYNNGVRNTEMSINEHFVHACENGDYNAVHRILEENPKFNIDVTDQLGRTAIRLAIENEHLEVVTLLLALCDGQKMREALLLAIYLGHVQIAEACLRHPKFKVLNEKKVFTGNDDSFWQTPSSDDAQFAPDITPLILASQYNRTEIVQLLLRGGDRITKPHDYHCKCQECHNKFEFDSLRHAQSRLNAYRGLASESYISLASIDPILTAFELGHELRDLSGKEKYFKNEYINLADQLSAYAVKLLDKVRGHKELDCVLGKTGKETEEKYVLLARLYLAIKYEEKPFVAHSNCQQKLVEIWHSDIRNISKLNPLFTLLLLLAYVFILPFACIVYILTSWSERTIKFQKFLKQPCIKFIGHTISFGIFIILIILSSLLFAGEFQKPMKRLKDIYPNVSDALNQSIALCDSIYTNACIYCPLDDDFYFRQSTPTWIDIAITIFVVGFLWHEIKQAYTDGLNDYLLSWNNIVDSCMNVLYISSFALKYYVFFKVRFAIETLSGLDFQDSLGHIFNLTVNQQYHVYQTIYWLNSDRFYWVSFDPVNVAEGLFAIANIFSFSRICFLLPAIQHLGPLQISLGRMMSDIGKFIIIFLIIFSGFMFGLNNLFWYYSKTVRGRVEIVEHNPDGTELPAEIFFGTMGGTFKTVFWSLFGLSEKDGVSLGNYDNRFTELIGYLIYGTFNIASVIVLLNMLIAMMSKSYETIEEHADVEWKFARSKLYMEYIQEGGTLPVPFNIIPTPKSIFYLYQRIFHCKKTSSPDSLPHHSSMDTDSIPVMIRRPPTNVQPPNFGKNDPIPTISNGQPIDMNDNYTRRKSFDITQRLTYRKVMERVIKRFLLHKQREEQDEIREGDFEELKQDIQMLRFEMMNRLDETRDDLARNSLLLNEGVLVVGELLSSLTRETNPLIKENFYSFKKKFFSTLDQIRLIDSGIESSDTTTSTNTASALSTTSMPNLINHSKSLQMMSTSTSEPSLSTDKPNDSDMNPVQLVKHLSAAHITLSNIVEENEENDDESKTTVVEENGNDSKTKEVEEIEIEVEARHISIQTSMPNEDGDEEKPKDDITVFKL